MVYIASKPSHVSGQHTIIGLNIGASLKIIHSSSSPSVEIEVPKSNPAHTPSVNAIISLKPFDNDIWSFIASFMERRYIDPQTNLASLRTPFYGGLMGYTTYELGLAGIDVGHTENPSLLVPRPDLCFAWVKHSMVINHDEMTLTIQQLTDVTDVKPDSWMNWVADKLEDFNEAPSLAPGPAYTRSQNDRRLLETVLLDKRYIFPDADEYERKVEKCQEAIRSGNSYELCLTDETLVSLPRRDRRSVKGELVPIPMNVDSPTEIINTHHRPSDSYPRSSMAYCLYRKLSTCNPAPYASFIRLGAATLVSSSPERFLCWNSDGLCELRPMKGTVRKSMHVNSLSAAAKLLKVPKEQAENLMIVDLVRHDLHRVCGSGNVTVPQLMTVEEHASVFQMISSISGQIPQLSPPAPPIRNAVVSSTDASESKKQSFSYRTRARGIDVLASSLPPGSMTGAPKKRSCEILQGIESRNGQSTKRSLYSGVVGYIDIAGRGDFSVTIRAMYRWDNEYVEGDETREIWHIGAGGAVTILSTPVGEREEMDTKLGGTFQCFER